MLTQNQLKGLGAFIADLEAQGELLRIGEEVSHELEITEIADRISKSSEAANKALLFENVRGYDMPVLINSMGSHKRMLMALGLWHEEYEGLINADLSAQDLEGQARKRSAINAAYDVIADRIREFIQPEIPEGLGDKIAKLMKLAEARNFLPRVVGTGACQEVVAYAEDSKLNGGEAELLDKLPIIKCWPQDAAPFVTLTSVFTRDPDALGSGRNVGMYRLQKFDDVTTGMHWHKHHDGARIYQKSLKRVLIPEDEHVENTELSLTASGSSTLKASESNCEAISRSSAAGGALCSDSQLRMEIAVVIGGDPIVAYCGTAPLPPAIDEMILAGFLRNKPVDLVKCKTVDLEVPADAEIVLEGYIDLNEEPVVEGPFGDHTGFYSLADLYPKFHLTAMTHKKNPVYATTIVGIPPQEDCYLGKATERIFLPLLQLICPEIVDMDLPWDGVFHNCALIKIDKQYAGHAQKVMNTIWGTGQMAWTKYVIVFDKDVDIHNYAEAAMHAFGNTDPQRDAMFSKGPLDILDHSSSIMGLGGKMGLDATRKWADEGFTREWPDLITMSEDVKSLVSKKWDKYFS